jgi:hypothetical protein
MLEICSFHHSVLLIRKEEKIINSFDFPNIRITFHTNLIVHQELFYFLVDSDSLNFETFICTKAFYSIAQKENYINK